MNLRNLKRWSCKESKGRNGGSRDQHEWSNLINVAIRSISWFKWHQLGLLLTLKPTSSVTITITPIRWRKRMKEIIYVQAGNFANYTGTHFWNAQESYLTSPDTGELTVETEISFHERTGVQVRGWYRCLEFLTHCAQEGSTFCPRLLAFDTKCKLPPGSWYQLAEIS